MEYMNVAIIALYMTTTFYIGKLAGKSNMPIKGQLFASGALTLGLVILETLIIKGIVK